MSALSSPVANLGIADLSRMFLQPSEQGASPFANVSHKRFLLSWLDTREGLQLFPILGPADNHYGRAAT